MRNADSIRLRLAELEADERHHYEPALVQINAPLALIQVSIQAKIDALKWVLNEKKTKPARKRN